MAGCLLRVYKGLSPSASRSTSELAASRPGAKAEVQCLGCVTFAPHVNPSCVDSPVAKDSLFRSEAFCILSR